jgi:PIN domain
VIYVDSSVALAQLLAEDRMPTVALWDETLVSSRLTAYEVWNRINGRGLHASHGEDVQNLLARFNWLEMTMTVLARALEPFPSPVRTLDALHLASIAFLRTRDTDVVLATYDDRMSDAARRLSIPLYAL